MAIFRRRCRSDKTESRALTRADLTVILSHPIGKHCSSACGLTDWELSAKRVEFAKQNDCLSTAVKERGKHLRGVEVAVLL